MADTPRAADPGAWQRYFAVEANNQAWALAEGVRDAALDTAMLNAAHAAAFHWAAVGTEIHHKRATMLLAEVHALLGLAGTAVAFADEVLAYFDGSNCPDWELAFVYTIHAHAHHVAGHDSVYRQSRLRAEQAIDAIADPADRDIVMQTFSQLPAA